MTESAVCDHCIDPESVLIDDLAGDDVRILLRCPNCDQYFGLFKFEPHLRQPLTDSEVMHFFPNYVEGPQVSKKRPDEPYVQVGSYSMAHQAEMMRIRLESEGIPVQISNLAIVEMDWLLGNAVGGVQLLVPKSLQLQASSILNRPVASESDETADEPTVGPESLFHRLYNQRHLALVAYFSPVLFVLIISAVLVVLWMIQR